MDGFLTSALNPEHTPNTTPSLTAEQLGREIMRRINREVRKGQNCTRLAKRRGDKAEARKHLAQWWNYDILGGLVAEWCEELTGEEF